MSSILALASVSSPHPEEERSMGPLEGVKVLEIGGIGPGPFCGMMLADMGAEVLRIDRAERVRSGADTGTDAPASAQHRLGDPITRGRRRAALDLKDPEGVEVLLRMVEKADVLFEGFRPGVMER